VTITNGAALAPDDEPVGADDEDNGILVESGTAGETGGSFVFVPHVIGGISLTVAPDVVVKDLPSEATDGAGIDRHTARPRSATAVEPVAVRPGDRVVPQVDSPLLAVAAWSADDVPFTAGGSVTDRSGGGTTPTSAPVPWADRVRAGLPFTGPGLTGLGGVVLGCLVVGLGAVVDIALGGGLGVGFTATFLLGCVLVAATLRTRALAVAMVLPPLLFAGGYALETRDAGQTSGRREMALDVATSLALHAPVLFLGTALTLLVVLVRVVVHLIRR
jgi:hypothetical protein